MIPGQWRRPSMLAVWTLAASAHAAMAADGPGLSVRITSPLGRMGVSGTLRIVAQIHTRPDAAVGPVRFYVDNVLLKEQNGEPPYVADWVDSNPFERRELVVEAQDTLGETARDSVVLKPFELTEVTQVMSVLLETAVRDRRGRFVGGLGASSFALREDGVPQTIDMIRQEALPATYELLIDSSQSMSRRIEFVRAAAERFAGFLRPQDRVVVAPFSRSLGAVTGPTGDRKTVTDAIDAIRPAGGTAIFDTLMAGVERLRGIQGRRAVLLLTDGYDENSVNPFEAALDAAKRAEVTVYVVGIGGVAGISLRGERMLRRLALETGGQIFFPPREQELPDVCAVIAADSQNRYLITYTPANQKLDGTWRTVALTTSAGDYLVETRPGYFAPKPPPIRPSLEFTVTDPQWRYVDVTADDLVVLENGVEQKIDTFQEAVTPVSVVLALDASGSMKKAAPEVVQAAREFVQSLRPADPLALVSFADQVDFVHDLTTDRDLSYAAIGEYRAAGGTTLYDAIADSLARLKRVEGRRVVVVVTDGRDENNPGTGPGSVQTFEDVVRRLRETGATVFAIGIGPRVNQEVLERLAQLSGGHAYFPSDVSALRDQYRQISETLRRRFVVSYTSTNIKRDGSWRAVEIRPRASNLRVSAPAGYYAPER